MLADLHKQHSVILEKAKGWVTQKMAYLNTKEDVDSSAAAQYHLSILEAFNAESAALQGKAIPAMQSISSVLECALLSPFCLSSVSVCHETVAQGITTLNTFGRIFGYFSVRRSLYRAKRFRRSKQYRVFSNLRQCHFPFSICIIVSWNCRTNETQHWIY